MNRFYLHMKSIEIVIFMDLSHPPSGWSPLLLSTHPHQRIMHHEIKFKIYKIAQFQIKRKWRFINKSSSTIWYRKWNRLIVVPQRWHSINSRRKLIKVIFDIVGSFMCEITFSKINRIIHDEEQKQFMTRDLISNVKCWKFKIISILPFTFWVSFEVRNAIKITVKHLNVY